MKKYLTLAALLALAACGSKQDAATPAADSVGAGAAVPADSTAPAADTTMKADTSMVRDTASH